MPERKVYTRPANFPTSVQIGGVEVATISSTSTLTNKTLTSPVITGGSIAAAAITDGGETIAATRVLTAADSGKTFFLSHATEFAVTLPAPAAGLHYRFFCANAPETASYTIVTASAAQILAGQVYASAGSDEDSETDVTGTTITFVDGAAVIGDSADVYCDGTSWFARCFCNATGGITITG